mmetsp:Transcript_32202/g.60495  ORF Transcript_32202/g.60495 Transcript_32202/m.60495 type:complete len:239 (-) Transcript_32202:460-1176(-)
MEDNHATRKAVVQVSTALRCPVQRFPRNTETGDTRGDTLRFISRVHTALSTRARFGKRQPAWACLSASVGGQCPSPLFELARAVPASGPRPTDEKLREIRVSGDGRCMFRSVALGLAANKNVILGGKETEEADQLRMACHSAMCTSVKRRNDFPEAVMAVKVEQPIETYCKRIQKSNFWGGEAELLVLSKMLKAALKVYIRNPQGQGYVCIQEYGREFDKSNGGKRKPVRLLFNGVNQ